MWTCNKVVKKLMKYALRYEITDLNKLKFTFYVLYIYVNLKKTEHLFTSIKLLEKKKLVYAPVMDVCMILVSYGITLLQMYPLPCLDILNNDSQIKKKKAS